jgi:hypothetical protein
MCEVKGLDENKEARGFVLDSSQERICLGRRFKGHNSIDFSFDPEVSTDRCLLDPIEVGVRSPLTICVPYEQQARAAQHYLYDCAL